MNRIYSVIILLAMAVLGINAQAESLCVTLHFTNGEITTLAIPEQPVMSFDGDDLVVKTNKSFQASYNRDQLDYFDFTMGETAAIDRLTGDSDYLVDLTDGNSVKISGKNLSSASLFNVSGQLLGSAKSVNGTLTLDLSNVEAGIYIIEIPGHRSLKIRK